MNATKQGSERASEASDLMVLPSTKTLRETWNQTRWAQASNTRSPLATGERNLLHPCYDPNLGLNALARAVLLRNVLKHEIRRDHRDPPPDAPWQIGIANKSHAYELFSDKALGTDKAGWLRSDGDNTATLFDLNWRKRLCDGFDGPTRTGVLGLNTWFGTRYQRNLPGGEMTPHLLFETRFFGTTAIDNYIRFLLHGIYVPSANHTLSSVSPYSESELERDPIRQTKLDELIRIVTSKDNGGRPIVTVSCHDNPTAGARLATTLVARLGERTQSACYIPLARHGGKGRLNDHGYRSIVEAIHRFVTGESSLVCSTNQVSEAELATMVHEVRAHLVTVPTVFVLDGFAPGESAYPALISFIRDEPIDRLLRLLQHPDTGDWRGGIGGDVAVFRQTFFVIVGTPARQWLEMHRQATIELQFTPGDEADVLSRPNMNALKEALRPFRRSSEPRARSEWHLNAMSFMARNGSVPDGGNSKDAVQAMFNRYWTDPRLKSWQRLFLQALALSESGLRWSTSVQIFESYARVNVVPGDASEDRRKLAGVGAEAFRAFIDDACDAGKTAPLLFAYADGPEADSYDIFDFPSQAIGRLSDNHPWITARAQKKDRWLQTVDYYDAGFRSLVLATIAPSDAFVIRRILAELALQNFRVRLRHSRSTRRIDRRASRLLAEALMHGVMSIEPIAAGPIDEAELPRKVSRKSSPVSPKFTQGEIPSEPVAAYSFLYSAIFVDLFCAGDPNSVARIHGNGELQLEILMLMCGATPIASTERAVTNPNSSVKPPPWWRDNDAASLRHMLAIAGSAKRAGRLEVMGAALQEIRSFHNVRPLDSVDNLALQRFLIEYHLLTDTSGAVGRRGAVVLREAALRAVVLTAGRPSQGGRWDKVGRKLLHHLRQLKLKVLNQPFEHQLSRLSPQEIDSAVDEASSAILKLVPARKLPKEALTLLTVSAWLESIAGDHLQRRREGAGSFNRYLAAVLLFWLTKSIAVRVRREGASAAPRVGFTATDGYVRTVNRLKEHLAVQDGDDGSHLRDRLFKSARGMLDTYTREQVINKPDHIAVTVLECTYVRTVLPRTALLARAGRPDLPTGDERLTSLGRCLQWLRAAEHELLSFSGQPAMRILLCRERVLCLIDMLNRVAEHVSVGNIPVRRRIDEGDGEPFRPLVDVLINDLRQYGHYTTFMKSYSPSSRLLVEEWTRDRGYLLSVIKASAASWRASMPGRYNESLDLLATVT
jgi:hypothetical protein